MPRTPENVAGAGHASGYTTNSNEHKYKRELYQVLTDGLLFSGEAAGKVITLGGIVQVDQFVDLEEKDCEEICTAIRKDGTACGVLPKKNLTIMCKVARYHEHIGRDIVWLLVTKAWVYGYKDQFTLQSNWTVPDVSFPRIDKKDLTDPRKLKEDILARFAQFRNDDGVPMDYVLRELLIPEDSPTFGAANSIYVSHDDELKLRYRILDGADAFDNTKTPEQVKALEKNGTFTAIYLRDRRWVYHKAKHMFEETPLWNHAAGFKSIEDGRGGMFAIFTFIFGHEYSKSLATKTIDLMNAMYYSGQGTNYDFDKHVTIFAGHAATLTTLEDEGTYRGMDPDVLCDTFLGTIKADFFAASKNTIYNDQRLRNDWTAAATHMKTYLETSPQFRNSSHARGGGGRGGGRKISEAKSLRGGGGRGRGDSKRRGGRLNFSEEELKKAMAKIRKENNLTKDDKNFFIPPDRYEREYGALERQAIFLMRGGKSRQRSGKRGRDDGDDDATAATGVSTLSTLTSKVDSMADSVAKLAQLALGQRQARDAVLNSEQEYNSDDESLFNDNESVASDRTQSSKKRKKTGKSNNRNHPALLSGHPTPGRQGTI